jgi:hypothetical protein
VSQPGLMPIRSFATEIGCDGGWHTLFHSSLIGEDHGCEGTVSIIHRGVQTQGCPILREARIILLSISRMF